MVPEANERAATALDSPLYGDMFGTDAMRSLFTERALVADWLTVEAALARAEGAAGLIPADIVPSIECACQQSQIDLAALRSGTALVGYPILPLVRQVARLAGEPAGGYVHWGATTQDIMDTAVALQVARARRLVTAGLETVVEYLVGLARAYRTTPMAGRTHGQQALPITLGYKLAVFIAELQRHGERLAKAGARAEMVQFAGAAGTLASVGEAGLAVQRHMAEELDLGVPIIAWHASRDGLAEFVAVLAMIGATLARLAQEVSLLQRTEIDELREGFVPGRGGSSTMPQKRNPITCEAILGANLHLRALVPTMLAAMLPDSERATGPWHAEWLALPEACVLTHGILAQAETLLAGLVVRPEAMRRNLALSGGLLNSEAVMMALAPTLGRQAAHDVVYAASMRAIDADTSFRAELLADSAVASALDASEIDRLLAPDNYLGLSVEFVDRVLATVDPSSPSAGRPVR